MALRSRRPGVLPHAVPLTPYSVLMIIMHYSLGVLPHAVAVPRAGAPQRLRALPMADADRGADDHPQRPRGHRAEQHAAGACDAARLTAARHGGTLAGHTARDDVRCPSGADHALLAGTRARQSRRVVWLLRARRR
eukprot:scaffold31967_cov66-Phaeocystis_antarctica.AAC.8